MCRGSPREQSPQHRSGPLCDEFIAVDEVHHGGAARDEGHHGAGDGMTAISAITGPLEGAIGPTGSATQRPFAGSRGRPRPGFDSEEGC